ncbi:MAG TPA: septation protein SepH [Streptosporangiaceae bacterium]|jgi:hypothetical protein
MHELRLVAVSEDGSYAVLEVPGRGGRYSLQIDDRLRAVARGQFSRLAQYEIEVESPLRPKEIQERIRAGETADEIADAAGLPIERIRWFEGPVLAERAYRAQEAQSAMVRRPGDSGPGPRLGEVVTERLTALGTSAEDATWDSTKRSDGSWQVQIVFAAGGRSRTAGWIYDPRRKHATPADDEAARLSLPEADLPPLPAPSGAVRGEATVTQLQPRIAPSAAPAGPVRRQAETPAPRRQAEAPARRAPEGPPGQQEQSAPQAPPPQPAKRAERPERAPAAQQAPEQEVEQPAAQQADAAPQEEHAPAAQSGRRAAGGRGRRSSVPSWDEIMFGSSRPRE